MTSGYMAVFIISVGRMLFLAPTLANLDPLFALVVTSSFYLHHLEMVDQDPASGMQYDIIFLC